MSVPSREQVNKWHLPGGIRFCDNGPADPAGTTKKELLDVKKGQSP